MKKTYLALALSLALSACGGEETGSAGDAEPAQTAAPTADPRTSTLPNAVQMAVGVLDGIEAAPDRPDSVLVAHGLTVAGFDSLMYRIAADSTLRAAFAAARR